MLCRLPSNKSPTSAQQVYKFNKRSKHEETVGFYPPCDPFFICFQHLILMWESWLWLRWTLRAIIAHAMLSSVPEGAFGLGLSDSGLGCPQTKKQRFTVQYFAASVLWSRQPLSVFSAIWFLRFLPSQDQLDQGAKVTCLLRGSGGVVTEHFPCSCLLWTKWLVNLKERAHGCSFPHADATKLVRP